MMLNFSGRGHWKDTAGEGFELAASRMFPWSQQARQLRVHCCIKAGFSNIGPCDDTASPRTQAECLY